MLLNLQWLVMVLCYSFEWHFEEWQSSEHFWWHFWTVKSGKWDLLISCYGATSCSWTTKQYGIATNNARHINALFPHWCIGTVISCYGPMSYSWTTPCRMTLSTKLLTSFMDKPPSDAAEPALTCYGAVLFIWMTLCRMTIIRTFLMALMYCQMQEIRLFY